MVIIGYGEYKGYGVGQVSDAFLSELAGRYPLKYLAHIESEYTDLKITIAVHEKIQRRRAGGSIMPREPSVKDLAIKLVGRGFQSLSKEHHPDRKGGSETTQKRLNTVRQELLKICNQMDDEYPEGALIIPGPSPEISDEGIPF